MELFSTTILYTILYIGLYFQIFLLLTFFEGKEPSSDEKKKSHDLSDDTWPTVSITVPCFNEAKTVATTVQSLLELDYPKSKLSILVVDDGSTDNTFAIAEKLSCHPQVTVVRQENGGKYTALNHGIKTTTAEFVGCLDADSFVDPKALKNMIPYFKDPLVMAVTPAMRVHNASNILQLIQKAEYNIGIFAKRAFGLMDAIHVTPGPFSIFRKSIFDEIGLFHHAHNTEDMEIAFRIQSHRYKIANCHYAFVNTITPETLKKLYKQRTRWLYGFLNNSIDYKHIFLNKKYGNMGMFTLPFSALGVVVALYLFASLVFNLAKMIYVKIEKLITIGIDWNFNPHFEWFFVNTETIVFLAIILVTTSLVIMLMGKRMAEGSMKPSRDMLYFTVLYGLIAPLWLSKAVYNTLLSKKTPWR